jgi:hypothetical protein
VREKTIKTVVSFFVFRFSLSVSLACARARKRNERSLVKVDVVTHKIVCVSFFLLSFLLDLKHKEARRKE